LSIHSGGYRRFEGFPTRTGPSGIIPSSPGLQPPNRATGIQTTTGRDARAPRRAERLRPDRGLAPPGNSDVSSEGDVLTINTTGIPSGNGRDTLAPKKAESLRTAHETGASARSTVHSLTLAEASSGEHDPVDFPSCNLLLNEPCSPSSEVFFASAGDGPMRSSPHGP
jgi:hypothetical protein